MPHPDQLPDDVNLLARRQALKLSDDYMTEGLERLLESLEKTVTARRKDKAAGSSEASPKRLLGWLGPRLDKLCAVGLIGMVVGAIVGYIAMDMNYSSSDDARDASIQNAVAGALIGVLLVIQAWVFEDRKWRRVRQVLFGGLVGLATCYIFHVGFESGFGSFRDPWTPLAAGFISGTTTGLSSVVLGGLFAGSTTTANERPTENSEE